MSINDLTPGPQGPAFTDGSMDDDSDMIVDQSAVLRDKLFVGEYPFNEILNSIEEQFQNYITTEDRVNYVEIFYTQLEDSKTMVITDPSNVNYQEANDILTTIYDTFVSRMIELFESRLNIGIDGVEENHVSSDTLTYIITRLYEYFILSAPRNFKVAIATYVSVRISKMKTKLTGDNYFITIQEMMEEFNPVISTIEPLEFLLFTGDREVIRLFNSGMVVGNFLRKYTPALYKNELFMSDIINYVTAHRDLGKDFKSHRDSIENKVEEEIDNGK